MSKIANYLGGHLRGEVMTGEHLRHNYATDGSIGRLTPLLVTAPFNTADVRKIAHFAWQLAEKGHVLPLTARGAGSSKVAAAIGQGAIVCLQTHMKKILEIDTKQKLVRLQPGVSLDTLDETMRTHGLIWPVNSPHPQTTVGGAVADNLFGEYGGKYGAASDWIDSLEIVTASGDCLQISKISKRELGKKKGLTGSEGEIYRQLDGLIEENQETVRRLAEQPGSAGYNLSEVKDKKGSMNLIPLLAGSQGTLGIITEIILRLAPYHPRSEVVAASLKSMDDFETTLTALKKLEPSRLEFVDSASLAYAKQIQEVDLKELSPEADGADPAGLLVVEFDDFGRKAKTKAKKCAKILDKQDHYIVKSDGDFEAATEIWQIYRRIIKSLTHGEHQAKVSLPCIEDALVPHHEIAAYLSAVEQLAKKERVKVLVWGHIGSGVMQVRPLLNLRNLSDKQKVDRLISHYYDMVLKLGGGVAGEYAEGRLRSSQAATQFDEKELALFAQTKAIFDTHGLLNPGVKASSAKPAKTENLLDEAYNSAKFS